MKLKKIILKNIRSYESQIVDFPEGSLLLAGDVGSGKTTLLLAIEYALFGLQPGQKGSSLLRNTSDLGEVTLEMEVAGREIIIERRIKRNSKSVVNDYASITIDGKKIESSITEVKTKILNLLGYPSEFIKKNNILYRYTVYTPQEQMKQIILEDPETRLNVLRHVFGIEKYKRIRENLALLLNRLKEDSRVLQIETQSLEKDKENLALLKSSLSSLDGGIQAKKRDLEENINQRKAIEKESLELEQKLKEKLVLESEVEKTKIMIASKKDSLSSFNKEFNDLSSALADSKDIFSQNDLDLVIQSLSLKKAGVEELNSAYIQVVSRIDSLNRLEKETLEKKDRVFNMDVCPTCLQNVPGAHKHNIMNATETSLSDIKKSLEALEPERMAVLGSLEKGKLDLSRLEEEKSRLVLLKSKLDFLENSRKKLEGLRKSRESYEKDVLLLSKHLEGTKQDILKFSKFENLLKIRKDDLKRAFIEEKRSEISIAELRKEIELSHKELANINAAIAQKESLQLRLREVLNLIDWISGPFSNLMEYTERNVLIKLRKDFSSLFSKWFGLLAGDTFIVQLDENFTPLIMQGEAEMEYSFLSGGERTAVALAYRLALNQTINSLLSEIRTKDLIILDEPTEGFSETQIDKIRDILDELNVTQLILVSHEQKIESFVENVLRLKKDGDVSSIVSTTFSENLP